MMGFRVAAATLLTCLGLIIGTPAHATAPTVQITYSETFDSLCAVAHASSIRPEWKRELLEKVPAFRTTWEQTGPATLTRIEELTGKRFQQTAMDIRLTLCDLPSNSFLFGININMRHALASFTDMPVPLRYKANILIHEILHLFLEQHPLMDSLLLREHADEPERVRDHLHLFALMKAAMLDQDQDEALAEMIRIDSQLPHPAYRRAWELVNRTPDEYLAYVAEMRRQRP